jgi:hypothetical protein
MKMTLGKKSGSLGCLSVRDVSEEKAVWFCRTALSRSLWVACWTNEKSVRLVTVSGKWDEIEGLYSQAEKDGQQTPCRHRRFEAPMADFNLSPACLLYCFRHENIVKQPV